MERTLDRYKNSKELLEKASQVIPLASQTFSKSHIQFPEMAPHFIIKGKGSRVWDVDGNRFLDFMAGIAVMMIRSGIMGMAQMMKP